MDPNELCELGSAQLWRMEYLECIATLEQAERLAFERQDWDLIARLYMPLQEARRQVRQRAGEGVVRLDLLATSERDQPDAERIVAQYPHGQLLVAGWASIEPALRVRRIARERKLFLETFAAAVYPMGDGRAVAIVPTPFGEAASGSDSPLAASPGAASSVASFPLLPDASPRSIDRLIALLPPQTIVLSDREIPAGGRPGSPETYAQVMGLWERLHNPFLAAADATADPRQRIAAYRATIHVDSACELAHQRLSATARQIARTR